MSYITFVYEWNNVKYSFELRSCRQRGYNSKKVGTQTTVKVPCITFVNSLTLLSARTIHLFWRWFRKWWSHEVALASIIGFARWSLHSDRFHNAFRLTWPSADDFSATCGHRKQHDAAIHAWYQSDIDFVCQYIALRLHLLHFWIFFYMNIYIYVIYIFDIKILSAHFIVGHASSHLHSHLYCLHL